MRRAALALAALCFCLGTSGAALAKAKKHKHHTHKPRHHHVEGGGAMDGRARLKRANALAGEGDCQAAIDEYTKAYELLGDPVVLFNRAECFRRVGDTDAAIDDYHEFLEKVPGAPNRKDIEAKIAAMGGPEAAAPPPKREPSPKREPPVAEKEPPPKREPPVAEKEPPSQTEPEERPPPPPPAPEPRPEVKPAPVLVVERAHTAEEPAPPAGTRPWVWVALAVLTAGAAAGGYFLLRPHQQTPPGTALGNYRF